MSTDTFIIEGRAFSWKALRDMRRAQLEAMRSARGSQPVLFELIEEDRRPESQRSASGRYSEPLLFDPPARPP